MKEEHDDANRRARRSRTSVAEPKHTTDEKRRESRRRRDLNPFTVGLLSGTAAGLTVNSCLFPLNTIKTRLQARAVGTAWRSPTLFKGLYRGFLIDTVGCIPGTGLFMVGLHKLNAVDP
jgi:hypothetical protein